LPGHPREGGRAAAYSRKTCYSGKNRDRIRMISLYLLLNLLMIFSSYLAACCCCKHISLSDTAITTFLFYISQVTFSLLFLGALVKNLGLLNILLLNGFVSLTIILLLRKTIKTALSFSSRHLLGFSRQLRDSRDYFLYLFLFLFIFQIAATLVKIYYLPPHVGDVFSYHLHPVVEWFQQGQILSYTDTPVWRANENPLGTKPLHLWFILFFRDITWIELPQFLFGLLLSLSAYAIIRKLQVPQKNALRYAILIYFIPAVLLQSRTCQDHLVFAACTLLAVYYAITVFFQEQHSQVFPLLLALSLLFGIKKHAVLVMVVLLFLLLLSRGPKIWKTGKANPWGMMSGAGIFILYGSYFIFSKKKLYEQLWNRHAGRFFTHIFLPLVLVIILFILLRQVIKKLRPGGYFQKISFKKKALAGFIAVGLILLAISGLIIKKRHLLKPLLQGHRNPTTEVMPSFSRDWPALDSKLVKNLLAFPFRIKDIGLYTSYTPDLLEKSGFGLQFFAFGLISYLMAVPLCLGRRSGRTGIMGFLLWFAVLLLLVYFSVYFSRANYRSFIFFGAIGIMLWSAIPERLQLNRVFLSLVDMLILLMILFNGATCLFEGNMSASRWKTLFTIANPLERTSVKYASLINTSKERETWEFIDRYIRAEESIGYFAGGAAWTFPYFDNRLKRRIYFLKNLPGFELEPRGKNGSPVRLLKWTPDFKASLKLRGIHFLHLSSQGIPRRLKIFMPENAGDICHVTGKLYYFKW
jgi:hypothetical protein